MEERSPALLRSPRYQEFLLVSQLSDDGFVRPGRPGNISPDVNLNPLEFLDVDAVLLRSSEHRPVRGGPSARVGQVMGGGRGRGGPREQGGLRRGDGGWWRGRGWDLTVRMAPSVLLTFGFPIIRLGFTTAPTAAAAWFVFFSTLFPPGRSEVFGSWRLNHRGSSLVSGHSRSSYW